MAPVQPRALAFALIALAACGGPGASGPEATAGFTVGKPPRQSAPSNSVGGFSIDLPSATLMSGEEVTPCFIFPLVVDGPSRLVGGASLTVAPGMHHGNITTRPKTGEGIRACPPDDAGAPGEALDIAAGGAVLFASSTQISGTEWQSFPEGMAYRVRDGFEIVARMHYLNVTQAPLTIAPSYRWYTIDEGSLTQELGPFAWVDNDIHIPPLSTWTAGGSCEFPAGMHLVNVLPHMHKLGVAFDAAFVGGKLDGQKFLDSPGYDPDRGVLLQYDPAIDLSQGTGASFSCTWKNTLDQEIVEGIGDNEMCILFGYAYPPQSAFSALASGAGCVYLAPPVP